MRRRMPILLVILAMILFIAPPSIARVKSVTITATADWTSANYSGAYGPYEWVIGRVTSEIDPSDPLNTIIVDVDKAPKNVRVRA